MTDYVPQDLANTFVASAERHFLALEQCHHLQRSLDAEVFGAKGIQQVRPEEVDNCFFMLTLTIKGPSFSIVITYGDREHDLSCFIRCNKFEETYALWEWLEILDKSELLEDSGGWVLTVSRIETVLAQYEQILEQLAPLVTNADSTLEHRLKLHRQERIQLSQQQFAEDEHRRLAFKAVDAFHRQDYGTVVETLSAVQSVLTSSEKAKLEYARKKLRN